MTNPKLQQQLMFSYEIEFRYKKFDKDLKTLDFIKSVMKITLDEPVPEPLQTQWTTIIQALNPDYFKIEIVDVKRVG